MDRIEQRTIPMTRAEPKDGPEVRPASPTRWSLVLLLVGAGIVVAFQIGKAPAALSLLRGELALTLTQAAWVISIFNVVGIVSGMALGALADRLGHRRMVLAGLLIVAVASAAGAVAPGAAPLLATRFAEGVGFMIVVVATPALIARSTAPGDLPLAFGFWSTYMPAGTAMMMVLAPLLIAGTGWRGLWIANAVLVGGFAVLLAIATRRLPVPTGRLGASAGADMLATLRAPGPRLLALSFAAYTLHYLAVLGFLPSFLIEHDGVGAGLAALLGGIAVAVNIPGNLLGGWIVQRGAQRWAVIAAVNTTMALCSLLIYAAGLALPLRYALCLLFSFVGGMLPAVVLAAGPALAPSPRHVATTNGLIMQGSNLGQVIGPPAIAALAARAGDWTWSPLVLGTAAGLGVLLALRLRALEKRSRGDGLD